MRTLWVLLGLTTVACLLAWGWLPQTDQQRVSHLPVGVLVGEQEGYLLTPPEFVAQPFIRHIKWSPDGKLAVLFQTALRSETPTLEDAVMRHRVLLWDRRTRRLRVLWESQQTDRDMEPRRDLQVAFIGRSTACLFAVQQESGVGSAQRWAAYVATPAGAVIPLGEHRYLAITAPPADTIGYIFFSVSEDSSNPVVYAPVGPRGLLAEPQPAPEDFDQFALYSLLTVADKYSSWHEDGRHMVLEKFGVPVPVPEKEGQKYQLVVNYFLWNPRTNQMHPLGNARPRYYQPDRAVPLQTHTERHKFPLEGAPAETTSTWLLHDDRATLIAADSALAEVSPQGDAILYAAHGAAFFREIKRLDAQQLREALSQAEREKYLQQAKQIALATLMYVEDYDEMFPPNFGDEGVAEVLMLYVKERSVFEVDGVFAFRYLLDGQSLGSLDSPTSTAVGYLEVSGGRIVIFADGHVKWVPNR
ncbi:MAG: hypothetical protein ACUVV1_00040 [Fimbriimonadales bacterium]